MTGEPGAIGLESYERRQWTVAHEALAAGDETGALAPADLERYAIASHLLGREDEAPQLMTRAHQAYLAAADVPQAARCAFWLGIMFMDRGEMAQSGGWMGRAASVLDEVDVECAERGYVRVTQGLQLLEGDPAAALAEFEAVLDLGIRFGDRDLRALGMLGRGQSLVVLGRVPEGAAQLDEVMVAVVSGEVSPIITGVVYCAVIEICQVMFDLRRAQEWTAALSAWCDSQPDLVPFRGRCLVYRAEVMRLHGEWPAAIEEALRAGEWLSGLPGAGDAYYCQGELHRVRGDVAGAEAAFRRAEEQGRRPEPGRALLRITQGRVEAAVTAIRHALDEAEAPPDRANLLPAAVSIFIVSGDPDGAADAADELARIARALEAPFVDASAERARGSLALAGRDAAKAMEHLRKSLAMWQALQLPYEAALTRELLAGAAQARGDDETARIHLEAAKTAYAELGARLDLQRLEGGGDAGPTDLTPRELEVLRLLATGMTNRAIANALVISEKTASNHVSNILSKLGLSSRAAATAFAHEHGLV